MTGSEVRRIAWWIGAPARWVLLLGLGAYRALLGGALASMGGGRCRYYPTCSHYADEAVRELGASRGSMLAIWRVLRCQPFGKGGADPVPARFLGRGRAHGRQATGTVGMTVSYDTRIRGAL